MGTFGSGRLVHGEDFDFTSGICWGSIEVARPSQHHILRANLLLLVAWWNVCGSGEVKLAQNIFLWLTRVALAGPLAFLAGDASSESGRDLAGDGADGEAADGVV